MEIEDIDVLMLKLEEVRFRVRIWVWVFGFGFRSGFGLFTSFTSSHLLIQVALYYACLVWLCRVVSFRVLSCRVVSVFALVPCLALAFCLGLLSWLFGVAFCVVFVLCWFLKCVGLALLVLYWSFV
jgi:hypothetical protein